MQEIRRKKTLVFLLFIVFLRFARQMLSKSHLLIIRFLLFFQVVTVRIFPDTSLTERSNKKRENYRNKKKE